MKILLHKDTNIPVLKSAAPKKLKITHGVPQGSVLRPLLFLLYINDLAKSIEYSSVHHFAYDTNILFINKSLKKISSHINCDLKLLCQWIRSNKFSLNASKTEIIIFKRKHQVITKHLNFKVSGQKINPTNSLEYLEVFLNDSLTWTTHIRNLILKLNRAIGLLAKIHPYTPESLSKTSYYSIFNSHLICACQIWGQTKSNMLKKVQKLQQKALWIIDF